jgi:hypothetical protein
LYNVIADRGKEDSKMHQRGGLMYSVLDSNGNKIGTPIKASDFYNKPTLKYLQEKFQQNETLRQQHEQGLKTSIKWVLVKRKPTLQEFAQSLAKERIKLVLRQNKDGNIYGLTYIDFNTKCVFNGSDLGKEFSAKAILEKLNIELKTENESPNQQRVNALSLSNNLMQNDSVRLGKRQACERSQNNQKTNTLELLLRPEQNGNYLPHDLVKKKKIKRPKME